jgi:hypothetical protein
MSNTDPTKESKGWTRVLMFDWSHVANILTWFIKCLDASSVFSLAVFTATTVDCLALSDDSLDLYTAFIHLK